MLKEQFPGAQQVETRSLHRGVPQAHHEFLALQPGEDKMQRLCLVRTILVKRSAAALSGASLDPPAV